MMFLAMLKQKIYYEQATAATVAKEAGVELQHMGLIPGAYAASGTLTPDMLDKLKQAPSKLMLVDTPTPKLSLSDAVKAFYDNGIGFTHVSVETGYGQKIVIQLKAVVLAHPNDEKSSKILHNLQHALSEKLV